MAYAYPFPLVTSILETQMPPDCGYSEGEDFSAALQHSDRDNQEQAGGSRHNNTFPMSGF